MRKVLTLCKHTLCNGTNSKQWVLTLCNEYLLYTTSTYSLQGVPTQYNEYLPNTQWKRYLLYTSYLLYTKGTYNIQHVFTLCNKYLLHATGTLCKTYLLYAKGTYYIQRELTHLSYTPSIHHIHIICTKYTSYAPSRHHIHQVYIIYTKYTSYTPSIHHIHRVTISLVAFI